MIPKSADTKYTGLEPEWSVQPTEHRISKLGSAFQWYNYHYGKKDAKDILVDWLNRNGRTKEAQAMSKVPEAVLVNAIAWMCRMNLKGLILTPEETKRIDQCIKDYIASAKAVKEVVKVADPILARPNIQDRLRDKIVEAAGELEGMFDDMILAGAKMTADYKPIAVLRGLNVAPQMVSDISRCWQSRADELQQVMSGKDGQLAEGYSQFSKIQLKNLAKFAETVISDCNSYVQIKKVERKPRKTKPVSPERLTQKFKYLKQFDELKLQSEAVVKLVGCQEAWFYDTKRRKLIYVVADSHVGTMTVKGSSLIGFDSVNSVQKTLRKPAEQIKSLLTGGVANTRKFFKDIKTTAVKFNGRGNDHMVLLKIR